MAEERVSAHALADLRGVPARSRWVRSGVVRLHVLDYGGDAPPMLVVPGITSPAITWDFAVRDLCDLVRPIVLDVRGRGRSDAAESYRSEECASDVAAVVEQLRLRDLVLLGHSMGARIAALAIASGLVTPAAAILVDPPTSGPSRGSYPTSIGSFRSQLRAARRGTTPEDVAEAYPGWPRRELELRARWLASCDERAVSEAHRGFEQEDFFAWWPAVPSPASLIHGAESPVVSAAAARECAERNPNARVEMVARAGHMVPWDNLEGFRAAMRSVIEEDREVHRVTRGAGKE